MGAAYEAAKKAVLARHNDMETCEHCAAYVDELVKNEMENRADPVLNTLGRPLTAD